MRSTNLTTRLLPSAVIAGVITTVSMAGAARAEIVPQSSDKAAENQLVFAVETSPSVSGTEPVILGARMGHQAMVYRFRVRTLSQPATEAKATDAWEITVYSASTGRAEGPHWSLARLSPLLPEVTLPRPLGYVLTPADSVVVVVRVLDHDAAPMVLRLTVDYEPVNTAFGRWAMLPYTATGVTTTSAFTGAATDEARTQAWEWTPSVAGRVVALIGAQFAGAQETVLADAETGEVLRRVWRAGRAQSGVSSGDAGVVWIVSSVQAGHTYRLTVFYGDAGPQAARAGPGLVHALVRPGVDTP
jgi:hypothetical protein